MFENTVKNIQEKSPKQRFLLVIGMLFFILYFVLGLIIIFMKHLPFEMTSEYRLGFGILLIVYSVIRCIRFLNDNKD
jgi:uncharacterized membrane protein (DUF485 family)